MLIFCYFCTEIVIMAEFYDIFISYSSKDSHVVHGYAKYLEQQGYSVWYDVKGLFVGSEFSQEIVTAIEHSKLFIFFSSENSNRSDWIKGEILTAQKFGKTILPVRIDNSEYDKSVMLVLLPLQYIECKGTKFDEGFCEEVRKAVHNYIGAPSSHDTMGRIAEPNQERSRKGGKLCMIVSSIVSLLLSFCWMLVSGEYWLNKSLAFFTVFVTAACCVPVSYCIIRFEKHWNERSTIVNIAFLVGILFFLSYSMMAFGLCFISPAIFKLNFPSIACAALVLYALNQLMCFKKRGYVLLWISALLFTVGSYWWLGHSLAFPIVLAVNACICMQAFTILLKAKHKGLSLWDRLK